MSSPRDTTNYIYRQGTAPNTRAAVSQKNKVYGYMVGKDAFQQIGAVSEFGHDESRAVDPIRGVGYGDQIAELVPGVTEPMTLTLNKTLLYCVNIFQTVGYRGGVEGLVRSLRHHRWPFDIKQELVFSELASTDDFQTDVPLVRNQPTGNFVEGIRALMTFYEGCWFNSYSASYTSDAAIVAENSSVTVTDVIDGASTYGEYIDSGLSIAGTGTAGAGFSLRFSDTGGATNTTVG